MRERRDLKFEVRGSKFRKPRTSYLEPLLVPPVARGKIVPQPARCQTRPLDSMEAQNSTGVVRLTSTAPPERAHSDRARSGSTEVILTTPPSPLVPPGGG